MAWELLKVEQQRLQLVTQYLNKEHSMTALCKHFGVSRKTGHKWYNIYLELGEKGLVDMSKSPLDPCRVYSKEQIELAIDYKLKHRTYGPKKVLARMQHHFPKMKWPCATRLYEIFKDHGLVIDRKVRNRVPATSPLADLNACNDTWAVDLKGWFLTGDGKRCEPLTITDCHSRYLISCTHLDKHSVEYVWPIFEQNFLEYGLPNRVRSDNGPPFGCVGAGRLTRLSVNLIKAGVTPEWIRPGHPEENGRHERFHLTLKQETASPPKPSIAEQVKAMNKFKEDYNYERPHEALNMETPGNYYTKSRRSWNGKLKSPEYDTNVQVRKVGQSGCIWLKQKEYYIGQTLTGEYVGLKQNIDEELEVYYGPVYLGKLAEGRGLDKPKEPRYR